MVTDAQDRTADDTVPVGVLSEDALVVSPIPYDGNAAHYEPHEWSRWSVFERGGDRRYFLNTSDYEGAGDGQPGEVSLVRDRRYEDFELTFRVRTNEDLQENTGADFVVAFGWQNPDNYYVILGHTQAQFTKLFTVEGGNRELVAELGSPLLPDPKETFMRNPLPTGRERSENCGGWPASGGATSHCFTGVGAWASRFC